MSLGYDVMICMRRLQQLVSGEPHGRPHHGQEAPATVSGRAWKGQVDLAFWTTAQKIIPNESLVSLGHATLASFQHALG